MAYAEARAGQSPENPVCVASAIVLDPTESLMLVGARLVTPNEGRHLDTVSTFTRTVPRPFFNELAGGDPSRWERDAEEMLPESTGIFSVGRGEHDRDIDTLAVEWVLGKVGLTELLAAGKVTGHGNAALRSLAEVPDKDTGNSEWTAMLHYRLALNPGSEPFVPRKSLLYDPILWVPADKVPEAFANHDAAALSPDLESSFFCLTGACMRGAASVLASRARGQSQCCSE